MMTFQGISDVGVYMPKFIVMKNLLLVVALFFLCQISYAQYSYGVKGGLNISILSFSHQKYDVSPKIGINLGAFGSYVLDEKISIRPEIYFSTEGNNWKTKNSVGIVKLNQLRIPILLNYQINERIFLEIGPQYNLLLSISQKKNEEEYENVKQYYKTGVLGFGIGARYSVDNLLEGLSVGVRYNGDFGQINDVEVGGNSLYNRVIQLNLSYVINTIN